jgi:rhodanese-related sulfurtransferase
MNFKTSYVFILLLMVVLSSCINEEKGSVQLVSPEEMKELQNDKSVQVVDVRTAKEHDQEAIPNSQNIDYNSPTFDEELSRLDKNRPVLLYCKTGRRSAECAKKLENAGFVKIYDLQGGISRWKYEGFDVESKS